MFDAFVETVTEALKEGDSVQIIGFGTFEVKERPARTGLNPATGETIEIAASKAPGLQSGQDVQERHRITHIHWCSTGLEGAAVAGHAAGPAAF